MRFAAVSAFSLLALGLAGAAACTEDKPEPNATQPPVEEPDAAPPAPVTLESCVNTAEEVYGNPGALTPDEAARGQVLKCTKDADVSKETMQALFPASAKPFTSNARVYRISYRTERGNAASTPSVSSAVLYVPETPRAANLPIVVAARGSRGQAARCAVSKFDPSLEDQTPDAGVDPDAGSDPDAGPVVPRAGGLNNDARRLAYALAGSGYAVIMPDLAGYANFGAAGNPPSGYAQAADVARSTLDGARALKKLVPTLADKIVLVGHSQGGHTALSALALAGSYGTLPPIAGVAVYAPLWVSQRSWGAVADPTFGKSYKFAGSSVAYVSVWYHYTQAELLDGPGEGKKLFKPEHQAAVESFIQNDCWDATSLDALGTASEIFSPEFGNAVGLPAALGEGTTGPQCESDLCTKWLTRYSADRPHLTGTAATTPILLAYGMNDTTIAPNRMRCAVDRLKSDQTNLTACVDTDPGHGSILDARGPYVSDWIGNLTLGEPAPGPCTTNEAALTAECAKPPAND